jgi:hypothetical protein
MAQTSLPSDCCGQPEKNGLFLEFKLFQIGSSITRVFVEAIGKPSIEVPSHLYFSASQVM